MELTDEQLKYLILGMFRGLVGMEDYPIKLKGIVDNYDEQNVVQSFTIVTESGLRFTTHVEFEGGSE